MRVTRRQRCLASLATLAVLAAACSSSSGASSAARTTTPTAPLPPPASAPADAPAIDVYANDRPNQLSPAVAGMPTRVYVPNSEDATVDEIDPATLQVVKHFAVGKLPQHVVPSWDLQTLYVANDLGNSLTPIDPRTGEPGTPIPVEDPYNLYFTPDGTSAIVVAEARARLDFRDPHTFALQHSLAVPCKGVDHMDFSADGRFLVASCEFAGTVIKVDLRGPDGPAVVGAPLLLRPGAQPQDVKLTPDGTTFFVADMTSGGLWEIDAATFTTVGFLRTGAGCHGIYVSRDSQVLYVSNRAIGTISVVDARTRQIRSTWTIPGRASHDMGGVSADGTTLWLSGRNDREVYALDTTTGALKARIKVGKGPHGLSIYPQPGTYSLGHTGVFR